MQLIVLLIMSSSSSGGGGGATDTAAASVRIKRNLRGRIFTQRVQSDVVYVCIRRVRCDRKRDQTNENEMGR